MAQDQRRGLTADHWADQALRMLAERGLAGIAVEPIAARLGATKGSFYWHFPNRDALVEAALERWERHHTELVIADIEAVPDPRLRLRSLFSQIIAGATGSRVEVTLLGSIDDPRVVPVLRRVTARRLSYVAGVLREAGFPEPMARRRAQLAYTAYLGHVQLAHTAPDQMLDDREYIDLVMAAVLD